MSDDTYSLNEVLAVTRMYWTIRERGDGSTFAASRMLDISRALAQLTLEERAQIMWCVWLEQDDPPKLVIAKMRHFLNQGA